MALHIYQRSSGNAMLAYAINHSDMVEVVMKFLLYIQYLLQIQTPGNMEICSLHV